LSDLLDLKRTDRRSLGLYVADPKGGEPYDVVLTKRAARALDAILRPARISYSGIVARRPIGTAGPRSARPDEAV
jgi:hypothetical protein